MGRRRIVLLFNEDNEKQMEVCDYLKSQPRCKTALITELVYAWMNGKKNSVTGMESDAKNSEQSIEFLKSELTTELLKDQEFIEKIKEVVTAQMNDNSNPIQDNDDLSVDMDFDEDMLLSGMAMFE
jgi:hypothetical protein